MFDFKLPLNRPDSLGLALGGGGAKGLAHIGFLKVLDELNITPAIICGTSMGALIGAMYCNGLSAQEIEDIYKDFSLLEMSRFLDLAIPAHKGLAKGDRISRFLSDKVGLTTFDDLKIPLKIVATDYWNKRQVILNHGSLVKAVRASISVPGIFEPLPHVGRILTDGGAVNPVPFDIIMKDADLVAAVDVTGRQQPESGSKDIPNIFECIMNSFHIMESALLENKLSKTKPHLLYQPDIVNISIIEFTKFEEIISFAQPEIERFRADLTKLKIGDAKTLDG